MTFAPDMDSFGIHIPSIQTSLTFKKTGVNTHSQILEVLEVMRFSGLHDLILNLVFQSSRELGQTAPLSSI